MIFSVTYYHDKVVFECHPESADEYTGFRGEDRHLPIKLINRQLVFKHKITKDIHPDIIGLICLVAFYPYIKKKITFPRAVSKSFVNLVNKNVLPKMEVVNGFIPTNSSNIGDIPYHPVGELVISNIDENVQPFNGANNVIAYGGGMDSTSLALLFPEYPLITQLDKDDDRKEMAKLLSKFPNDSQLIECNIRSLSAPWGFTGWCNGFLVPLLLASEMGIKNIMCGDIMDMCRIIYKNRQMFKYFKYTPFNHIHWINAFKCIGINLVFPIIGCSELITSKIVYDSGLHTSVLYCQKNNGAPCHKCSKCFRKLMLLNYHGYQLSDNIWDQFNYPEILTQDPLCFGHIYVECIRNNQKIKFKMIKYINDLTKLPTSIFKKINPEGFDYLSSDIKKMIIDRLSSKFDVMSSHDMSLLKSTNFLPTRVIDQEILDQLSSSENLKQQIDNTKQNKITEVKLQKTKEIKQSKNIKPIKTLIVKNDKPKNNINNGLQKNINFFSLSKNIVIDSVKM